jgi:hypothetical protein
MISSNLMGMKSPSDGCWMVETGQRCDEPLHEKEEGRPYRGHFGRARLSGDHPLQMGRLLLMDRMPPEAAGRFMEHVAVCWGHLARVAAWRSPRRANILLSGC